MRGILKVPKGLHFELDFISIFEEERILTFLSSLEYYQVIIHDNPSKRSVKHFGYKYSEKGEPELGEVFPHELEFLRQRCAEKVQLQAETLASCLIAKYSEGSGVGWHSDARVYGSHIFGVSLASDCTMQFQQKPRGIRHVYELSLPTRSFYIMSGESRYFWQHRISATKALRYSITFRTLN